MRLGLICECARNGPDIQVCRHFIKELLPEIGDEEIESVAMVNKKYLVTDCGDAAASLLSNGCERVIVVWDLQPAWKERGAKPCRREDRQGILRSLAQASVDPAMVHLVCIHAMLEAWLLVDGESIENVLRNLTGRACGRVPDDRDPARHDDPKMRLDNIFRTNKCRPYQDFTHAIKIARALTDLGKLDKLRRVATFARFEKSVTGR